MTIAGRTWPNELTALVCVKDGKTTTSMDNGSSLHIMSDSTSNGILNMEYASLTPDPGFVWWLTVQKEVPEALGAVSTIVAPPASNWELTFGVLPGTPDYEGILELPYTEITYLGGIPSYCSCGAKRAHTSSFINGPTTGGRPICPVCVSYHA